MHAPRHDRPAQPPSPLRSGYAAPFAVLAATLAATLGAAPAQASSAKTWSFVAGEDFAKGDLDGLALHPQDGLSVAPGLRRIEVDAELVHCWLRDGDKLWLGTGVEGRIFLVEGDKAREVAQVGAALVASLASDGKGGVYAGLVGKGEIVHVDASGKQRTLAKLEDVQHVWALLRRGDELLAATGPGGKVFAVRLADGKARVFTETDTEHALVLLQDRGGVLVGTAGSPMLLRLADDGKATAIASFPGSEVRSVVRQGDRLLVAINGSPDVIKAQQLAATPRRPGKDKGKGPTKAQIKKQQGGGGQGAVWVRRDDGQLYPLFSSPVGLLAQIGAAGQRVIVGAAAGGRLLIGDAQGEVQTLFDLDEGAVLGVEVDASGPRTLFTGRSAAVYRVTGAPARSAYTTEVLRAAGVARWGRVELVGAGKLRVETRSGYANPANETWSPWQPLATGERVQSPAATMLQVRVHFEGPGARLQELHVHRRLINRTPAISRLEVRHDAKQRVYDVSWAATDPDGDAVGYVVTYRRRGSRQWLVLHDRTIHKTQLKLSPQDMPDGWYEVRVEASDAGANTPAEAQQTARISKPFLVDRGRPQVSAEVKDGVLTGVASDATSRIVRVEVSFSGEPTVRCQASDGVLDGLQEAFELPLPPGAGRGGQTLIVQAHDEQGNVGVATVVLPAATR